MRGLVAFAVAGLFSASALAGLSVAPVRLQIDAGARSTSFTATDTGADPRLVQVTPRRWTRERGEDHYDDDARLIVTPPLFRLSPGGGSQVVRLGFATAAPPSDTEQAWRVFVEEVPDPATRVIPGQVRLQLKLGLPLFVPPLQPRHELAWRLERGATGVALVAENRGNVHARFDRISLRSAAAKAAIIDLPGPLYVFPGETRRFPLARAPAVAKLRLQTQGGDGPAGRDLALPAP